METAEGAFALATALFTSEIWNAKAMTERTVTTIPETCADMNGMTALPMAMTMVATSVQLVFVKFIELMKCYDLYSTSWEMRPTAASMSLMIC